MGSGTMGRVAQRLGHTAVGIEFNPSYVDIIYPRLGVEQPRFRDRLPEAA